MLDYNHRPSVAGPLNGLIDGSIEAARAATTRDFHECRMCPWAGRCWGLPA